MMNPTKKEKDWKWNIDRAVMLFAGVVILLSLLFSQIFSDWWLLLGVFAGFNLIQSVFTGFCPPALLFRKCGLAEGCAFSGNRENHRESEQSET